jgi:hypothetical protein
VLSPLLLAYRIHTRDEMRTVLIVRGGAICRYYAFYESAVDSAEKFCGQMDALQREIGERGRSRSMATALLVDRAAEGVPPTPVLAPAPVPAPAPVAAAPAAAPPSPVATALAPPQSVAGGSDLTPTIQQPSTISMLQQTPDGSSAGTPGGGDFFAMTAFFREERTHMEHKVSRKEASLFLLLTYLLMSDFSTADSGP